MHITGNKNKIREMTQLMICRQIRQNGMYNKLQTFIFQIILERI